jgi:tRNA (mo5U34)-methyltransferase
MKEILKLIANNANINPIKEDLIRETEIVLSQKNGNIPKWERSLESIKQFGTGQIRFTDPYILIDNSIAKDSIDSFLELRPWRKGPYQVGNISIDSEWDGSLKWKRLESIFHLIRDKEVLDIGSGNGYFSFLLSLFGAKHVLAIEPFLLFNYQFHAINSLIEEPLNITMAPLRLEQLTNQKEFDLIFSMGVLYHQKDHLTHLIKIKELLKTDGYLLLETLIVDGKNELIVPKDRYAKMRNVFNIPSIDVIEKWLAKTGFKNIELIDVNQTKTIEQRKTLWIGDQTESLEDFLDKYDSNKTIEGYPAPKRAMFLCN